MVKKEFDQEIKRCEEANKKYEKYRNKKINKVLFRWKMFRFFNRKHFM